MSAPNDSARRPAPVSPFPRKVIAVDFDDTIRDWKTGAPMRQTINAMSRWVDQYHFLVVYTARLEADRTFVENWLKEHNVKYDLLQLGKMRFDKLVDDKAIRPEEVDSWNP